MKEKFKTISILLLGLLLFGLVGCGSDKTADKKNPPTNQEYYDYLTERYNYYFNIIILSKSSTFFGCFESINCLINSVKE